MNSAAIENQTLVEAPPVRPRLLASYRPRPRVLWADRVARWTICVVGISVILAVVLILVFLGKEAAPLFQAPAIHALPGVGITPGADAARMLTWNTDEFQINSYGLRNDGHVVFFANKDGRISADLPVEDLTKDPPAMAWSSPQGDTVVVATRGGAIKVVTVKFKLEDHGGAETILTPRVGESPTLALEDASHEGARKEAKVPFECVRLAAAPNATSETLAIALLGKDGTLLTGTYASADASLELKEVRGLPKERITAIGIDTDARFLIVATDQNTLSRWDLTTSRDVPVQTLHPSLTGSHVTSIAPLIGGYTWILGFADGSVEAWFGVRRDPNDRELALQRVRRFESHSTAVAAVIPSGVNRGFWTRDTGGGIKLHFNPSARKLFTIETGGGIAGVAPNAQLTGVSVLMLDGGLRQWTIDNPHPDVSWRMLFGKVWYEGYGAPEYIWQSSSGSDNFEAKYSLVPLMTGTLKGALFGLLFAIPLAVMAALYASQLMHPRIRSVVKPTIEIMAALPSVVIGFLAGLWIAPFLEQHLVAFGLVLPVFLFMLLGAATLYFRIPLRRRTHIPPEAELGIMLGLVALSLVVAHWLAAPIENAFFGGNIQQWIYDTTGQKVEQRNSIVIGLAMGFAVIPIIFSISEDAMSNVPRHYVSGSLALGATRWQSAVRVVLPTASPGIFSAVMLGFGRAVGETMIVLMATGNTPILSFSPFNGMRTLSANIAVEIPEAPVGGSLYRLLFLAAILLFAITFIVNTAAELIRMRLRDKYRAL